MAISVLVGWPRLSRFTAETSSISLMNRVFGKGKARSCENACLQKLATLLSLDVEF